MAIETKETTLANRGSEFHGVFTTNFTPAGGHIVRVGSLSENSWVEFGGPAIWSSGLPTSRLIVNSLLDPFTGTLTLNNWVEE